MVLTVGLIPLIALGFACFGLGFALATALGPLAGTRGPRPSGPTAARMRGVQS